MTFGFYCAAIAALLAYMLYRLRYTRSVLSLTAATAQSAALAFLVFLSGGARREDPFAFAATFIAGIALPCAILAVDAATLRKKLKARLSIRLGTFVYLDDRAEATRIIQMERFVDSTLKPRADNEAISVILEELNAPSASVERNVRKQLEDAERLSNEADLDAAFATLQGVERIFGGTPALCFNMGNICYARGEFPEAARMYEQAASIMEGGLAAQGSDGSPDAAASLGRDARLAQWLKDASDARKDQLSRIFFNLGNAQFLRGKAARSVEAYLRALTASPSNSAAYYNLSFAHAMDYSETGDLAKAAAAFDEITKRSPNSAFAWLHYGKCLHAMNEPARAAECLQKAVDGDPASYDGWRLLAAVQDDLGKTDEAISSYRQAIDLDKNRPDAYNNLGVLLCKERRHAEAISMLHEALRRNPTDAEIQFNIGVAQFQAGKNDEALEELLSADRLKPDDGSVLYMIAVVLATLNNRDKAAGYLRKAIDLNPRSVARAKSEDVFAKYADHPDFADILA